MNQPTFYIETFGCQMNKSRSEHIAQVMVQNGYQPAEDQQRADIILFNTCAVREHASEKAISNIQKTIKDLNKISRYPIIVIFGCLGQFLKNRLAERIPTAQIVIGTSNIDRLPQYLKEYLSEKKKIFNFDLQPSSPVFDESGYFRNPSQIFTFLPITYGCNNFCSYCVVPYVRGREESRKSGDVLAEVREMAERGIVEVTLLGQNVNSYNNGSDDLSFSELLCEIDAIPGISRLRFVTSHPKDISPELIACFGTLKTLCESIHLPFQSGSDRVLALMNRGYTSSEYLARVEALKEQCPGIAFTADCIVGFPGENEGDFEATMRLMETVRFDGVFSFIYSARRSTAAALLPGRVPPAIAHERLSRFQKRQRAITLDSNRAMEGTRVEVLVEGQSKNSTDELSGRTRTGKIVNFRGDPGLVYKLVEVDIIKGYANSLRGELPDTPGR